MGMTGCLWVAYEFLSSLRELRNASAATKERRKEEENRRGGKGWNVSESDEDVESWA